MRALGQIDYEPPDDVQDILDEWKRTHPTKRKGPKFMSRSAVKRRAKQAGY
jgi:hypothetical protein